jgi:hypothetical protein
MFNSNFSLDIRIFDCVLQLINEAVHPGRCEGY